MCQTHKSNKLTLSALFQYSYILHIKKKKNLKNQHRLNGLLYIIQCFENTELYLTLMLSEFLQFFQENRKYLQARV